MIKRLYLADGAITTALSAESDDIAVDTNIASLLATLHIGDHCYLTLIDTDKLEVIKIRREYSGFRVDRAQDGTVRQGFPAASKLTYRLTAAEIKDATSGSSVSIYSDGQGLIQVSGKWVVDLPLIKVTALGGVDSRTEGSKLVLFDRVGMFGCCDSDLTGAPAVEGPYFYLTSQLYPQESVEVMTPNPKDRSGNAIAPINIDMPWWLLTQPSIVEPFLEVTLKPLNWDKFGGSKVYDFRDQYAAMYIEIGDWITFGGQKEFTSPPAAYIVPTLYPLEMLMYGGAVEYNNAVDKYIWPTLEVLDWTLANG